MAQLKGKIEVVSVEKQLFLCKMEGKIFRVDMSSLPIRSLVQDARQILRYGEVGGYSTVDSRPKDGTVIASISFENDHEFSITYKPVMQAEYRNYVLGN